MRIIRTRKGFTLIELVIAAAIVSILAAIAYPSYVAQIQKSRRADAKATLLELTQFMERHYTRSFSFLESDGANPTLPFTESPKDGTTKYYDLSFSGTPTASTFTLQAVPKGAQANDRCGTMTISNTGAKTPTTDGCWGN